MHDMTHLRVARVGVEHVAGELARDGDAGDDQTVDVVRVDDKVLATRLLRELAHPVKVHEEAEEHLVARGAVPEDAEEVRLERDRGDVAGVEGQGHVAAERIAARGRERAPDWRVVRVEERRCRGGRLEALC